MTCFQQTTASFYITLNIAGLNESTATMGVSVYDSVDRNTADYRCTCCASAALEYCVLLLLSATLLVSIYSAHRGMQLMHSVFS